MTVAERNYDPAAGRLLPGALAGTLRVRVGAAEGTMNPASQSPASVWRFLPSRLHRSGAAGCGANDARDEATSSAAVCGQAKGCRARDLSTTVATTEATRALLSGVGELEDYGERGLVEAHCRAVQRAH